MNGLVVLTKSIMERKVPSMQGVGEVGLEGSLVRADNIAKEVHVVKGC